MNESESEAENNSDWGTTSPPTEGKLESTVKPATDEEFEKITGVSNKSPDAIGVAVTPQVVSKHREQSVKTNGVLTSEGLGDLTSKGD